MIPDKISYLLRFPPSMILKKVLSNLRGKQRLAEQRSIWLSENRNRDAAGVGFQPIPMDLQGLQLPELQVQEFLFEKYRSHEFDHLGCGWSSVAYGANPPGFQGIRYNDGAVISIDREGQWLEKIVLSNHIQYSRQLWGMIGVLAPDYQPIDWQRDHKSGFRWDARLPWTDQNELLTTPAGVDVKIPLELSRLQHLPRMATWLYGNELNSDMIAREIKCQLLDFMISNPVGMGVNYTIAMDVGLRIANILLTCDILFATGHLTKDDPLLEAVRKFVIAETRFLLMNLEYRDGYHSNHYLGNVVGVLSSATHLKGGNEPMGWLLFAAQELESCMQQFMDDGANFEGSTAYHKLCTEMMAYGTAFVHCRSKWLNEAKSDYPFEEWNHTVALKSTDPILTSPFSDKFYRKLSLAGEVLRLFTKPDGRIIQVGDNDSARLFPLSVQGTMLNREKAAKMYEHIELSEQDPSERYFDEDMLSADGVLACVDELYNEMLVHYTAEAMIIRSCVSNIPNRHALLTGFKGTFAKPLSKLDHVKRFEFPSETDLTAELTHTYLPDFGIIVFRSGALYLALNLGTGPKLHVSWGHQHNDKLSIELWMNGENIIIDPGSYCYTADPAMREAFRSTGAHSTFQVDGVEQNDPLGGSFGLFALKRQAKAELLSLSATNVTASLRYKSILAVRQIEIHENIVLVVDSCNRPFRVEFDSTKQPLSLGYGKLVRQ